MFIISTLVGSFVWQEISVMMEKGKSYYKETSVMMEKVKEYYKETNDDGEKSI